MKPHSSHARGQSNPLNGPETPIQRAADPAADRRRLERLWHRYHHPRFIEPDPLQIVLRHDHPEDRAILGLLASALAYGSVRAILTSVGRIAEILGPSPTCTLLDSSPSRLRRLFRGFRHRVTGDQKLTALLLGTRGVLRTQGSLNACFHGNLRPAARTTLPALEGLVDAITAAADAPLDHLLPHPRGGSACKRLHLFLRWMVRCDAIDPGPWAGSGARPDQLIVPLDTHVHRIALAHSWTSRRSPDGRAALEITAHLRRICPEDPLRYDFAMTRPGIRNEPAAWEFEQPAG